MPQRKRASEVHVNFTHGHSVQAGTSEPQAGKIPHLLEKTLEAIKKLNSKNVKSVAYSDAGGKNSVIVTLLKSRKAK